MRHINIGKVVRVIAATLAATASACAFAMYMGQGIVAGSLIGLEGREHDVAIAQQRAIHGLVASVVFQVVCIALVASVLDDAERAVRYGVATVVSLFTSCLVIPAVVLVAYSLYTHVFR